jgi:hypothetical protein
MERNRLRAVETRIQLTVRDDEVFHPIRSCDRDGRCMNAAPESDTTDGQRRDRWIGFLQGRTGRHHLLWRLRGCYIILFQNVLAVHQLDVFESMGNGPNLAVLCRADLTVVNIPGESLPERWEEILIVVARGGKLWVLEVLIKGVQEGRLVRDPRQVGCRCQRRPTRWTSW